MKYIIDIPDDRVCDYVGSTHLLMPYTMAGHKGHHDTGLNLTPYTEPDNKVKNNYTCLCDTCKFSVPDCKATAEDVLYGDGLGNDNVCCCNEYQANTVDRKQIEDAQEEAWSLAKKVALSVSYGGLSIDEMSECFGKCGCFDQILKNYSYQEAKAKYEAWMADKKQKEASELEEVTALANRIGIHRLYSLVKEIRGE